MSVIANNKVNILSDGRKAGSTVLIYGVVYFSVFPSLKVCKHLSISDLVFVIVKGQS